MRSKWRSAAKHLSRPGWRRYQTQSKCLLVNSFYFLIVFVEFVLKTLSIEAEVVFPCKIFEGPPGENKEGKLPFLLICSQNCLILKIQIWTRLNIHSDVFKSVEHLFFFSSSPADALWNDHRRWRRRRQINISGLCIKRSICTLWCKLKSTSLWCQLCSNMCRDWTCIKRSICTLSFIFSNILLWIYLSMQGNVVKFSCDVLVWYCTGLHSISLHSVQSI